MPKNPEYDQVFKQSWKDIKNNLELFVPSIITLIGSIILILLFFWLSGFFSYVTNLPIFYRENPFYDFALSDPVKIVLLFIAWMILEFLLATYISAMKYAMAKDIVEKNSTSIASAIKQADKYFFKVLHLEVLILAVMGAPAIILFIIWQVTQKANNIAGTFFLIAFAFIFAIYLLYLIFNLIFVYPVLFFENKKPIITIKHDFHYVRTHFIHTLIAWLIVIATFMFFFVLKLPFNEVSKYSTSMIILIIIFLVIYFLEVVFSNWEHLFVMRAYLEGKNKKL